MERDLLLREVKNLLQEERETPVEYENRSGADCKNLVCWMQENLNTLKNAGLTASGKMNEATRNALRSFQLENGLNATGKADPATERLLMEKMALKKAGMIGMPKAYAIIRIAQSKIEDWTAKATVSDEAKKLVTNTYRNPAKVWALVLHHMAFKRKNRATKTYSNPESYLATRAHFCILFDGRIIQLHPISRMIWHSNCTSPGSVGVEFEGNFPTADGKWWIGKIEKNGKKIPNPYPDKDHPTKKQVAAGRFLIHYLKTVNNLKTVLAHRQSSKDRTGDPGPDIWYNVGEWALKTQTLSDGGPDFKCGDGNPIHPKWKTWGAQHLVDG